MDVSVRRPTGSTLTCVSSESLPEYLSHWQVRNEHKEGGNDWQGYWSSLRVEVSSNESKEEMAASPLVQRTHRPKPMGPGGYLMLSHYQGPADDDGYGTQAFLKTSDKLLPAVTGHGTHHSTKK